LGSGLAGVRHRISSFDLFLPFVACYGPLVGSRFAGVDYGQLVFLAGPRHDEADDGFLTGSNQSVLNLLVDGYYFVRRVARK
jgi:hypothetical protein